MVVVELIEAGLFRVMKADWIEIVMVSVL